MNRGGAGVSLASLARNLQVPLTHASIGKVVSLRGPLIVARLPHVAIGDVCYVSRRTRPELLAQAVSFDEDLCYLAPFDELEGVSPHAEVRGASRLPSILVGPHLIGKVIDPLGQPFHGDDFELSTREATRMPLHSAAPNPLLRKPIKDILQSGVRSLDLFATLGYGQRMGLFSGPGVGKSTLLGMIARNSEVDLSVIALVGERGREVNEFLQESLGVGGLQRSIVVVSTSDESPLRRVMAAQSATAIAEYFRSQGKRVLLLVDSLTRVARAIRDVSLAAGELPLRQGFTPSVYAQLPRLLERAGTSDRGSITGIYTILTQNDEANDALGEEVKSILDGHIVLNSDLASEGVRPAIDIVASISRLHEQLNSESTKSICKTILRLAHRLQRDKDIVLMGGQPDKELQIALKLEPSLRELLTQSPQQAVKFEDSLRMAKILAEQFSDK